MTLPLEVKQLIYTLAFGGNLIHIVRNPDKGPAKFRNTICRALISEEEAQQNFDNETMDQWEVPANKGRHECCRLQENETFSPGEERPQVLRLDGLRCCRQIYNEAHHIPYATNTLSCADPETLQSFIMSLAQGKAENHLAVRSFFIEMVFRMREPHQKLWTKVLCTFAKFLKNVQKVNICFDWGDSHYFVGPSSPAEFEARGAKRYSPISDILVLKKMSLKSATVVVSHSTLCEIMKASNFTFPWRSRWTLAEEQEWARYVKEVILK